MSEATTATVDTQDNTNVSTEQATQSTEADTPIFDTSKDGDDQKADNKDGEEDKPFMDVDDGDKDGDVDDKGDDKPKNAPEQYEPFNVDLGKDIDYQLSEEQSKEFSEFAKELDLNQEQAQKIVDFDIKRNIAQEQQFVEQKKQALKEDTESIRKKYGEEFDKAKVFFDKAYKTFMPEKLRKIFIDAGFDRNPELFDMMVNIGKQIGEDTFVNGEKKVADPESFGKYSELLPQNPRLGKLK